MKIETVKNLSNKILTNKNISMFFCTLCILSLIPLLYVGLFCHPTGDDIYYGIHAREVFQDTHSLWQTLQNALTGVAHDYNTWQGTYAAMFLMRLQPTVFSENLYWITPFLVVGALSFGLWVLLNETVVQWLSLSKHAFLGIYSLLLMLCLQWVINPGEAFYWFNGAVYYSGFFGLMLLNFGLLAKYLRLGTKKTLPFIIFLEILIGGSNYLSLLWSIIVFMCISAFLFLYKNPRKWTMAILTLLQVGCFVISAIAPGNQVRAATTASLPAWKAILFSLKQGFSFLGAWLNGWWFLGALCLGIFLVPALFKASFRFPMPLIVVGFLFGFFSSLSCPTFYAQSNAGPGRALNLSCYGFLLTSYTALFYVIGYLLRKYKESSLPSPEVEGGMFSSLKDSKLASWKGIYALIIITVLFFQIGIGYMDDTLFLFTSVEATKDILDGSAVAYHQEYLQRMDMLRNAPDEDVVLVPFVNRPLTILVGDYGSDPEQVSNQALAKWCGNRSVQVDYGQ